MSKAPSFPLYTADLIKDISPLNSLTRGVWFSFLAHAHTSPRRGEITKRIEDLAKLSGETIDGFLSALQSIIENETGDVEINGIPVFYDMKGNEKEIVHVLKNENIMKKSKE